MIESKTRLSAFCGIASINMVSEAFSSHVYRESVHINRTLICSYLRNPIRIYVSNLIGYVWKQSNMWKLEEND